MYVKIDGNISIHRIFGIWWILFVFPMQDRNSYIYNWPIYFTWFLFLEDMLEKRGTGKWRKQYKPIWCFVSPMALQDLSWSCYHHGLLWMICHQLIPTHLMLEFQCILSLWGLVKVKKGIACNILSMNISK